MRVSAGLSAGGSLLPDLWMASSLCAHGERERAPGSLLIRALIPSWGPHPYDLI